MLVAGWTAAAGISLWYNITKLQDQARDSARIQAVTAFEKDVLYRRWNAGHGGVFVAVEDGKLRPNPYLPPEGRDITDAQGKTYTKVNPAFMTRLVHELGALSSGIRGHITSNNPIRRENAPDPWEKEALKQMERREASEVTGVVEMEGTPYLRYIGSLVTEESCLSCHASQGYKLGDVRGGISVSVPMLPFYHAMQSSARTLWLSHGALWLMGLLGISFGMNRLARRIGERDAAEMRLISLAQELEERVAERTMDLKAREQELRAFVDNVDAGVFLKETDGIYRFANVRFASMFKLGIDAIPGSSNADIFPPSLAAAIDSVESRVISDVHGAEYRHNQEGSPETGYNFFIFPLLGKGKNKEEDVAVGLGGLVVDMTDRDRAEKTLREARDAAERATEAKTRFLAKMSHEIRTPLNSIIGMAEILMRRVNAQEAYQEIREFVSIIQQSGMSLLAIINDILDFSKIESGSLQLSESGYSFASLLNDVINIASVQIVEHKTINFIARADVDIPHELLGDEVRVRQIFVNLLSNAVKYTSYGYIMLDVKLAERNGDEVTLDLTSSPSS